MITHQGAEIDRSDACFTQIRTEHSYLGVDRGWRSWLFTLDHKRIGVMYLAGILACFLLGGIIALVMGFGMEGSI